MNKLVVIFLILHLLHLYVCYPYQNVVDSRNQIQPCTKCGTDNAAKPKPNKKDIFVSRGWGAGGMPFSVLYMNPSFSSSKAPATVESNPKPSPKKLTKSVPQVRTSMATRPKGTGRGAHPVIPQLFVSYGWGPLGRK